MRYVNDPEVREAIEDAATHAVHQLELVFPGGDNHEQPGITSNFQGLLEVVLEAMLRGLDPFTGIAGRTMMRTHYTTLPELIEDDPG